MTHQDILHWLTCEDDGELETLWRRADETRAASVGDEIYLRGLVEVSNYCCRLCTYCGLRADNSSLYRYRMDADEVVDCARQAVSFGYGTVVLQAGEDFHLSGEWFEDVISRIKSETPVAVTLSLGERKPAELERWKKAGADRYLLRFETSNRNLFDKIHPPRTPNEYSDRMDLLRTLSEIGYEVGSGVMIGIPGQTWADLANDILAFSGWDLDMVGVGPFIPHPATPLGNPSPSDFAAPTEQVPATELMTYKTLALTRLLCPTVNLPATTALATINPKQGRELALKRGANIIMPNITPLKYRTRYEIYPGKAAKNETAEETNGKVVGQVSRMGRTIGSGRGDSPHYRKNKVLNAHLKEL